MGSKKTILTFVFGAILLVIIVPLFLDYFVFGNSVPSNLSNSEWATFLGGYIGAIVGALISLAGIFFTINFTKKQSQEERRIQVAPYLNIQFKTTDCFLKTNNRLDYILFSPEYGKSPNLYGILTITNVGFGPLLNCCITDVRFNGELFPRAVLGVTQNALEKGGVYTIPIGLYGKTGQVKKEFIGKYKNVVDPEHDLDEYVMEEASEGSGKGELSFYLSYNDIVDTPYQQKISLKVSVGYVRDTNRIWSYSPSLMLTEIQPREMKNDSLKTRTVAIALEVDKSQMNK